MPFFHFLHGQLAHIALEWRTGVDLPADAVEPGAQETGEVGGRAGQLLSP